MFKRLLMIFTIAAMTAVSMPAQVEAAPPGQPSDWQRFYHYPYVYYPHTFQKPQRFDSMYYKYGPSMRIPVYNKSWYNFYRPKSLTIAGITLFWMSSNSPELSPEIVRPRAWRDYGQLKTRTSSLWFFNRLLFLVSRAGKSSRTYGCEERLNAISTTDRTSEIMYIMTILSETSIPDAAAAGQRIGATAGELRKPDLSR